MIIYVKDFTFMRKLNLYIMYVATYAASKHKIFIVYGVKLRAWVRTSLLSALCIFAHNI